MFEISDDPEQNNGWMGRNPCPAKPVLKDAFAQSLLLERSEGRKVCGGTHASIDRINPL